MKAKEARVWLGFPPNTAGSARYALWRSEIGGFMQMHEIQNKKQAGATKWQTLKNFAIGHRLTRGYEQAYNGQDGVAKKLQEALETLLFDIRQKEAVKRKRSDAEEAALAIAASSSRAVVPSSSLQPARGFLPAQAQAQAQAPAQDQTQALAQALSVLVSALPPPQPTPRFSRGVLVSRIDPDTAGADPAMIPVLQRPWEGKGVICYMGMVHEGTIAHLISLGLRNVSTSPVRKVRDLIGSLRDPIFDDMGEISRPPMAVPLTTDDDVEAWLNESKAFPLRLMVLLERLPPDGVRLAPQSPPPPGWTHIDNQAFETVEEPTIESSDEEGPITRTKRRPGTRAAYQKRIERLRDRRARLQRHIEGLRMRQRERFPLPVENNRVAPEGDDEIREKEEEEEE